MRQLLMTMLMVVTVVFLYMQIAQGNDGTNSRINESGTRMADHISRLSP